ncbi:sigma-54 interaction domain-containing protein [Peribacillus sp. SCS-37]|uniref:sigma-54 interaction domain-containing protein n=1 Tax=Paraperibacillus esterisolvens TaxID=3115296 RepID=UPI003905E9DC
MPKILAVTKDNRTYKLFFNQISAFFNGKATIISPELCQDYENVDIILLSSKELQDGQYPEEKVLIARRTINIARLEELISLPAGTECLVVNNLASSASETIEILENLGFELTFYPYYPGIKTYQKVEAAIIPEALEMVPTGINRIIDIGLRPLDFSTLIELSLKLNINIDRANIQSARYIQEIIKLSRNLSHSFKEVAHLNHQLDAILNTVHEGILATDAEKKIIKINRSAKSMLGMHHSENEIIGKKVSEILPKLKLDSYIKDDSQKNHVISFNERKLIINNSSIVVDQKNSGDVTAFQDVTRIQALEQEIRKKIQKKGLSSKYSISDIIGKSQPMKDILHIMNKLARTDRTVLIFGENGTGKELFAHSIHQLSLRHSGPFIPVNFAGLPESLAESELFGYEEGTFTGAVKGGKQGLFELAHNGTIFLDEIGDAPKSLQTLLLRVLQEKQVMRVGGRSIIPINVRVIAATNKDLKKMVEDGSFREDLYYRLFVLPLRVPSLRDRKEDIPELISHFFEEYCPSVPALSDDVLEELVNYHWPGNVRELASVVQYMITVMENNVITLNDLPEQFRHTDPTVKIDDTLLQLTNEGDLIDFHTILCSLLEAIQERKSIGRGKIVTYAKEKGVMLTDQQVRRRMETLRDLGFIQSGTKGQGSKLTQMGMNSMKEMERIISENEKVMKRLS